MHQLLHWKAQHVVVDLPSVDREVRACTRVCWDTFVRLIAACEVCVRRRSQVPTRKLARWPTSPVPRGYVLQSDEGQLLSHRVWWQLPARGSPEALGVPASISQRTITELAYVPDAVEDGAYMLNLCIAPIVLDAAPSRPVLHALTLNLTTPVL